MLYTLLFDAEELAAATSEGEKISRTALARAMRYAFGNEPEEIEYNECGKPRFASGCPAFSISHSGQLVAILLSDTTGEVGVDIERKREVLHRERIEKRMLSRLGAPPAISQENKIIFLSEGGEKEEIEITRASADGFFERWTLLEALLKREGGGFRSLGDARQLLKSGGVNIYKVAYRGEEYALAVAE